MTLLHSNLSLSGDTSLAFSLSLSLLLYELLFFFFGLVVVSSHGLITTLRQLAGDYPLSVFQNLSPFHQVWAMAAQYWYLPFYVSSLQITHIHSLWQYQIFQYTLVHTHIHTLPLIRIATVASPATPTFSHDTEKISPAHISYLLSNRQRNPHDHSRSHVTPHLFQYNLAWRLQTSHLTVDLPLSCMCLTNMISHGPDCKKNKINNKWWR